MDMTPQETACVHVQAFDSLQNATSEQVQCSAPLVPPPMPTWRPPQMVVVANPAAPGLVGLDAWLWVAPAPTVMTVDETDRGIHYVVSAAPIGADWSFGDGTNARYEDASAYGQPYPLASSVRHTYQAHSEAGYTLQSSIRYAVTWTAHVGGRLVGPYPLGDVSLAATPLLYPVEQAQPELTAT
jgi:hypothetical protein